MTTIVKIVPIPIMAGSKKNMKLHKVGFDTFKHTYLCHPDGDKQLLNSERIKRTINKDN